MRKLVRDVFLFAGGVWPHGRVVAALLVIVLAALSPLASAAHIDQTWVAGLYDAADQDELIVAALSLDGTAATSPRPQLAIDRSWRPATALCAPRAGARVARIAHDRAPPSA